MFVDRNLVQRMKETYPAGTRIVLDFMGDDPRPIEPGTKGTVRIVDDMGTVHCDFDNGRRLGLVPGEDSFHVDLEQEKEKNIQVVLCEPGKKARVTTIQNDLASLQKMVGGYIEAVYPFEDPVGIICNEEGKINGMELNRALRDDQGNIYDILTGPFLVVGLGEEDFASLSKGLQEKYCKLFEHPEVFFRVGNEIESIKVEAQDRPRSPKHR
jgi:hypothetical protein